MSPSTLHSRVSSMPTSSIASATMPPPLFAVADEPTISPALLSRSSSVPSTPSRTAQTNGLNLAGSSGAVAKDRCEKSEEAAPSWTDKAKPKAERTERPGGGRGKGKEKVLWSEEETEMLVKGCNVWGVGKWSAMLADPNLQFQNRTPVDLKDRFRTYFPDAYRELYPNAKTHIRTGERSRTEDGKSIFAKGKGAERRPFTEEEDVALKRGYEKYGTSWSKIARDPIFINNERRSTDLRDRFRNRFYDLYLSEGYKPRLTVSKKKASAAAEAASAAAQTSAASGANPSGAGTSTATGRAGRRSGPKATKKEPEDETESLVKNAEPAALSESIGGRRPPVVKREHHRHLEPGKMTLAADGGIDPAALTLAPSARTGSLPVSALTSSRFERSSSETVGLGKRFRRASTPDLTLGGQFSFHSNGSASPNPLASQSTTEVLNLINWSQTPDTPTLGSLAPPTTAAATRNGWQSHPLALSHHHPHQHAFTSPPFTSSPAPTSQTDAMWETATTSSSSFTGGPFSSFGLASRSASVSELGISSGSGGFAGLTLGSTSGSPINGWGHGGGVGAGHDGAAGSFHHLGHQGKSMSLSGDASLDRLEGLYLEGMHDPDQKSVFMDPGWISE